MTRISTPFFARSALALALSFAAFAGQAADLGSNLILNGNAEAGTSSWSAYAGTDLFQAVAYGNNWVKPNEPGPVDRGSFLFAGQSSPYSAGYQLYDLSNLGAAVASGQLAFKLDGYLGGWTNQGDNAQITVFFRDSLSNLLGTAELGPVTAQDRNNQTGLLYRQTQGFVPVGTTAIELTLSMERLNSNDNDGYADNLSFVLNTPAVPEPSTYALMALGLGGLFVARRRAAKK